MNPDQIALRATKIIWVVRCSDNSRWEATIGKDHEPAGQKCLGTANFVGINSKGIPMWRLDTNDGEYLWYPSLAACKKALANRVIL